MNQKRIITVLAFILYVGVNLFGQKTKIDSLFSELKKAKYDTTCIVLYNAIGVDIQRVNLDSSLVYFNKALSIANQLTANVHATKDIKNKQELLLAETLRLLGITYSEKGEHATGKIYLEKALSIFELQHEQKQIAICYRNIGVANSELGNYDSARFYLEKALALNITLTIKRDVAKCYSLIGNSYNYQGNYNKAIEAYYKALKINEELQNKVGISACFTNMGGVYYYQKNYEKAIGYYLQSLKIDKQLGDKSGISINYNNIGLAYTDMQQYSKALYYYMQSLTICEGLGEKSGIIDVYNNIGLAYKELKILDKAINYFIKSLKLAEELHDKNAIITANVNLADLYVVLAQTSSNHIQQLKLALEYGKKALSLAKEAQLIQLQNYASKSLMQAYKGLGNKAEAFIYAELYIATNDSMFKKEKTEALAEMEAKYQNEKKQKEIELLEKDSVIAKEREQKQHIIIIGISLGLLLLVFMVTFILRRLRITRKQKRIIEENNKILNEQNEEISAQRDEIENQRDEITAQRDLVMDQKVFIEEQNLKITDSINYAKNIQQAVLPSNELMQSLLSNHFIFFKPKDIVSGDFYWVTRHNEFVFMAVADCTGHGVPGAFMSMLGVSFLNEIVRTQTVFNAAEVLNQLRTLMISALNQSGQQGEQKDGMDIVFCILNKATNILQYAGAFNPLYIVTVDNTLQIIKADKQPISIAERMTPFTNNEIRLNSGDCIYMTTDGYKDQFGGPYGKKFMGKQFTNLLQTIAPMPMEEQKEAIQHTLNNWCVNLDQIDDITVIGIRI